MPTKNINLYINIIVARACARAFLDVKWEKSRFFEGFLQDGKKYDVFCDKLFTSAKFCDKIIILK